MSPGPRLRAMKKVFPFPIFGMFIVINSEHKYFGIRCDQIGKVFSKLVTEFQDRKPHSIEKTDTLNASWKNVQRPYARTVLCKAENSSLHIFSGARMNGAGRCHKESGMLQSIQLPAQRRQSYMHVLRTCIHDCPYILRLRLINRRSSDGINQQQEIDASLQLGSAGANVDILRARRIRNVRVARADSPRPSVAAPMRRSLPPNMAPMSPKGPRCRASGCLKGAYFGVEDGYLQGRGRPEWCSIHRLDGHTNVRDKRCQFPEVA
jgi:hypothetical protein